MSSTELNDHALRQKTVLNLFPEATVSAQAAFRLNQSIVTYFCIIITFFNLIITRYYLIITDYYTIIMHFYIIIASSLHHYYVIIMYEKLHY